ncbi:MAG: SMC-Scp complex subunit ScpB, partial [Candidatus Woesearchaeota archaeon]
MAQEKEKREESEDFENQVNSVEAVLFASGKPMTAEEISKICKLSNEEVLKALGFLKKRYESGTSLTLIEYNNAWKLTVREKFIGHVRKIVPHTELTKTLLETLAVIAWKAPVLQSDIIKIRTNKAYDHINELAAQGFITKEKHGKTALLKLTKKFYDYFEIDETTDLSKILNKMQPSRKKPQVEFYGEKERKAENKQRSIEKKEEYKDENKKENDKIESADASKKKEEKEERGLPKKEQKKFHGLEEEQEEVNELKEKSSE